MTETYNLPIRPEQEWIPTPWWLLTRMDFQNRTKNPISVAARAEFRSTLSLTTDQHFVDLDVQIDNVERYVSAILQVPFYEEQ